MLVAVCDEISLCAAFVKRKKCSSFCEQQKINVARILNRNRWP